MTASRSVFVQLPAANFVAWKPVSAEGIVEHGIAPAIVDAASVDEEPATGPLLPGQLAFIRSRGAGQLQRAAAFIGGESGAAIQAHGLSSRKLQAASKDDKDGASADIPASRALVSTERRGDDEEELAGIMRQARENVRRRREAQRREAQDDNHETFFRDTRVRAIVREAIGHPDNFETLAIKIIAENRKSIILFLEKAGWTSEYTIEDAIEHVINAYVYPRLKHRLGLEVPQGTRAEREAAGVRAPIDCFVDECLEAYFRVWAHELRHKRAYDFYVGDVRLRIEEGEDLMRFGRRLRKPPVWHLAPRFWKMLERHGLCLPGTTISFASLCQSMRDVKVYDSEGYASIDYRDRTPEYFGALIYRSIREAQGLTPNEAPLVPGLGAYEKVLTSIVEVLAGSLDRTADDAGASSEASLALPKLDGAPWQLADLQRYKAVHGEMKRLAAAAFLRDGVAPEVFEASSAFASLILEEDLLATTLGLLRPKHSVLRRLVSKVIPPLEPRRRALRRMERRLAKDPVQPKIAEAYSRLQYCFDMYWNGRALIETGTSDERREEGAVLIEAASLLYRQEVGKLIEDLELVLKTGKRSIQAIDEQLRAIRAARESLAPRIPNARQLEEDEAHTRKALKETDRALHPDEGTRQAFAAKGLPVDDADVQEALRRAEAEAGKKGDKPS